VSVDLPRLQHTALTYRTTDELVGALAPLVGTWLSGGDRVILSLGTAHLDALRCELGAASELVWWSDTSRRVPHPARRLREIHEIVENEGRLGHVQVRFVGERSFPAGLLPELISEWERFDVALDGALADAPLTVVCTFDLTTAPERALEHVAGTHPMLGVAPALPSMEYRRPADLFDVPSALSPLSAAASHLGGQVTPAGARTLVRDVLGAAGGRGSAREAAADLSVVVTELVTNAWQAGARSIDVWCWHSQGEMGVQVDDDGPGLHTPLAGYWRPPPGAPRGRGLWIVRQLTDLVGIASDDWGTSVRAQIFEDRGHRYFAQASPAHESVRRCRGALVVERRPAGSGTDRRFGAAESGAAGFGAAWLGAAEPRTGRAEDRQSRGRQSRGPAEARKL
jgi:anti-sigma regulatory factor (Ser/Thr protein kinase)